MPNFVDRYASLSKSSNKYISESLPNITGFANLDTVNIKNTATHIFWRASGAFIKSIVDYSSGVASYQTSTAYKKAGVFNFDASKSSSTYVDNANVKPNTINAIFCIKY